MSSQTSQRALKWLRACLQGNSFGRSAVASPEVRRAVFALAAVVGETELELGPEGFLITPAAVIMLATAGERGSGPGLVSAAIARVADARTERRIPRERPVIVFSAGTLSGLGPDEIQIAGETTLDALTVEDEAGAALIPALPKDHLIDGIAAGAIRFVKAERVNL